jgi:anti-sigma factor RsiW
MMHCELQDIDLIAFADGELRGARLEYVEVHLRVCHACQVRLAAFYETTRLLQHATR